MPISLCAVITIFNLPHPVILRALMRGEAFPFRIEDRSEPILTRASGQLLELESREYGRNLRKKGKKEGGISRGGRVAVAGRPDFPHLHLLLLPLLPLLLLLLFFWCGGQNGLTSVELWRIKRTEGFLECNLFLCIPPIWLRINGNPAWKKEGGWMDGWMDGKESQEGDWKIWLDMARTFFTFNFNPLWFYIYMCVRDRRMVSFEIDRLVRIYFWENLPLGMSYW